MLKLQNYDPWSLYSSSQRQMKISQLHNIFFPYLKQIRALLLDLMLK